MTMASSFGDNRGDGHMGELNRALYLGLTFEVGLILGGDGLLL